MNNNPVKKPQDIDALELFFNSELYHQVQMSGVFNDSKTFADAIPNQPVLIILSHYEQQKGWSNFSLAHFVKENFTLPASDELKMSLPKMNINQHINALWPLLCKQPDTTNYGSLLTLDHPYIVPGGRFREIYYWDSYFTALGLVESGQYGIVEAMLNNFINLIMDFGSIPNGNRSYYLSRSQPPILALLVDLVLQHTPQDEFFMKRCVNAIQMENDFWMKGTHLLSDKQPNHARVVMMDDGSLLNRYWDDKSEPRPESYKEDIESAKNIDDKPTFYRHLRAACESGWDFSSRWLTNPKELASIATCDIIPIDLNCLLFQQETLLAKYYHLLDDQLSVTYTNKAMARKKSILKYLWSQENGFFYDYNLISQSHTSIKSLAAVLPLYVHIATPTQAIKVAAVLQNEFLQTGGLVTTTQTSAQQWDSPNGWAPLQWFAVQGLLNYEGQTLASHIMQRWLTTVEGHFSKTGKLMEKYNVCEQKLASGGEYDVQEGFGWTNAVYQIFYRQLKFLHENLTKNN